MSLVEYYDPDGLFPLIAPQLQSRLPLHNLHWKSVSRPLRSIATLHVELTPSSSGSGARNGQPVRRHQLPGLRPTPYLKIFLLRCDDKENYKSTGRKALREWLSANTPAHQISSSGHKADNHDAFEWLILHVVFPNTSAAAEPRWRATGSEHEPPKEKSSSNARWPGKPPRTILEKIRADFNHSSKSSPDRVAQVRLTKDVHPPEFMPPRPSNPAPTASESSQEQEIAWSDLMTKFKTLILLSFNLRVTQYEDDIREKESHRNLPGWNFCTFFVLKEGLAQAFESVGLVEDALVVYDELSLGLELLLSARGGSGQPAEDSTLLPQTKEMHNILDFVTQRKGQRKSTEIPPVNFDSPLRSAATPYRELIASNEISPFQFRCYLLSRRMALLSRLIWPSSAPRVSSEDSEGAVANHSKIMSVEIEDSGSFATLCQVAVDGLTALGRMLRADLWNGNENAEDKDLERSIDALVRIWMFKAAEQLLRETASFHFPDSGAPPLDSGLRLPVRGDSTRRLDSQTDSSPSRTPYFRNVGLAKAAANRAELYMFQRNILSQLSESCRFMVSLATDTKVSLHSHGSREESDDDDNDDDLPDSPVGHNEIVTELLSLPDLQQLRSTFQSKSRIIEAFSVLTDRVLHLFHAAGRPKSAEKLSVDMAMLKYRNGDFAGAAAYFSRTASTFADRKWNTVESSSLQIYAECMKVLNRKDEYVRVVMALVAKCADHSLWSTKSGLERRTSLKHSSPWVNDGAFQVKTLFPDIVEYSSQLPYDFTVPMKNYYSDIRTDQYITLCADQDGFRLGIELRQLFTNDLQLDSVHVRLVDSEDGQSRDIWLRSQGVIQLNAETSRLWLDTNVSALGPYIVDKIVARVGKIVFVHETLVKSEARTPLSLLTSATANSIDAVKSSPIFCFPGPGSLYVETTLAPTVHVANSKALKIIIFTGSKDVEHGKLRISSASAGLRIQTSAATTNTESAIIKGKPRAGEIELGALSSQSVVEVLMPFDVEQQFPNIAVRVEMEYRTSQGSFIFARSSTINVELPLDVNVQDTFKERSILSNFVLRTIDTAPLRLLDTYLEGSEAFEVQRVGSFIPGSCIDRNRFLSCPYKVRRRLDSTSPRIPETSHRSLRLNVKYSTPSDELVSQAVMSLAQDVEGTEYRFYFLLLKSVLQTRAKSLLNSSTVDGAKTHEKLVLPSYYDMEWDNVLESFPEGTSDGLRDFLSDWHKRNNDMHVALAEKTEISDQSSLHHLMIDFEVPHLQFLHVTSLRPNNLKQVSPSLPPICSVGDTIEIEVSLKYTMHWNLASNANDPEKSREFCHNVNADLTTWIVGGQRRGRISAPAERATTFHITLVPLRPGFATLPVVDVTPVVSEEQIAIGSAPLTSPLTNSFHPDSGGFATCETDCLSRNHGLIVVEGVRSTTFGLGSASKLNDGVSMIESSAKVGETQ